MIRATGPTPVEVLRSAVPSWARGIARRLALGGDGRWALALIAAAVLIRLGLLLFDWPRTDSDEGTMGLMALHILTHGEHPLFFYGQSYMGTLQAYLGAGLFTLFGPSVLSLRLGLLLLDALFLATMYALLRLLYPRAFALFSLALLGLGSSELLRPQLLALGGYPETLLFGALSLLVATRLALSADSRAGGRARWLRLAAYAGFGALLGVGWWSDQLVLPYLLAAVLLLVVFRSRDLSWERWAALLLGLGIVLVPQVAYAIAGAGGSGPSAVAAFQPKGMHSLAQLPAQVGAQVAGTWLISLPDITGGGWLCSLPVDGGGALAVWPGAGTLACAGWRAGWSLGVLVLGAIAVRAAVRALRASGGWRWAGERPQGTRREAVTHFGRLALLVGAGLTLAMYVVSPAAIPPGHARYLIGLNIALPAIIYPLWSAASTVGLRAPSGQRLWRRRAVWCWGGVGVIVLALAGGVAATYRSAPTAHAQALGDQVLARDLERLGVRRMYTDYWTCYKVAFLTRERITCDVLGTALEQGNNRYPPYVAAVQADPRAAYVFPADSAQAAALARKAADSAWHFTPVHVDEYVVYLPKPGG
jgi:hypothetical protein